MCLRRSGEDENEKADKIVNEKAFLVLQKTRSNHVQRILIIISMYIYVCVCIRLLIYLWTNFSIRLEKKHILTLGFIQNILRI